ncbi:hypothetical protein SOM11_00815 [Frigoribacterium sp. CFBP9039]|uniref:hypothetical protein n=1 Tax=Frigoribacterium sp. CFBP9029 TaxID=3096541 RepID=UPI002A6A5536|nr:hypothetical protein [Frigoribacterium sp. CFBP9039]MDY0944527.1 hypothetical protein [Frigoribacterium sp. CFBP9039]
MTIKVPGGQPENIGDMLSQMGGANSLASQLASSMPTTYYDSTPSDTERNTRRAADETAKATEHMRSLTEAMAESVRLSVETRAHAARAAEETRKSGRHAMVIGYSSLGLSVASLVIAVLALIRGLS